MPRGQYTRKPKAKVTFAEELIGPEPKPKKVEKKFPTLDQRIRQHALTMKTRVSQRVDFSEEEIERALELAKDHGEFLSTVIRACFRYGLENAEQWASRSGYGFFAKGDLTPRSPRQADPEGLRRPGPAVIPPFVRSQELYDGGAVKWRFRNVVTPQPSVVDESFDEPIYSPPAVDRSLLPSAPHPGEKTVLDVSDEFVPPETEDQLPLIEESGGG